MKKHASDNINKIMCIVLLVLPYVSLSEQVVYKYTAGDNKVIYAGSRSPANADLKKKFIVKPPPIDLMEIRVNDVGSGVTAPDYDDQPGFGVSKRNDRDQSIASSNNREENDQRESLKRLVRCAEQNQIGIGGVYLKGTRSVDRGIAEIVLNDEAWEIISASEKSGGDLYDRVAKYRDNVKMCWREQGGAANRMRVDVATEDGSAVAKDFQDWKLGTR